MKPKTFLVQTRLASLAFTAGGISIADALARADEGLDNMGEASLSGIDTALTAIESRFGPTAGGRDNASTADLYRLLCRVIDMSGALPGSDLDQAARAFCDLIDLSAEHEVWDWQTADLHTSTLRMLRTEGQAMAPAARAAVLDGLLKVTRKRIGEPLDEATASP